MMTQGDRLLALNAVLAQPDAEEVRAGKEWRDTGTVSAAYLRAIVSGTFRTDESPFRRSLAEGERLRGLWRGLGVAIAGEDIDEARQEMWDEFPREDV